MPRWCAAATASATPMAVFRSASTGLPPFGIASLSSCPSTSSIVRVTVSTSAPQAPARDNPSAKGTGSIKGRVVAAESGRPVRRVQISLTAAELGEAESMSTTAEGFFEFKDLPAGRYTIAAARAGFVRLQYGQRHPGEPGRPVQLADGQRVENLDFSLPRAGWISGRITDELGDPLPGVTSRFTWCSW